MDIFAKIANGFYLLTVLAIKNPAQGLRSVVRKKRRPSFPSNKKTLWRSVE